MSSILNIVIFTCGAREHLLARAWKSYVPFLNSKPHRRILAIDGSVNQEVINLVQPDIVVQSVRRRGYINSIFNALPLIDSKYFVWLEDDWTFNATVKIEDALTVLDKHPSWVQVRWSKEAPLTTVNVNLTPGVCFSSVGFSANPSICRTELVREGFKFLQEAQKGNSLGVDGFENVLSRWATERQKVCAVFDPGETPAVSHIGSLESTGRQWHMTASIEALPKKHIPTAGVSPPFWRRFWMLFKLARAFAFIGSRQFFSDAAYDLSFRIMATEKTLSEKPADQDDTTEN
jgi:hypothetical protein